MKTGDDGSVVCGAGRGGEERREMSKYEWERSEGLQEKKKNNLQPFNIIPTKITLKKLNSQHNSKTRSQKVSPLSTYCIRVYVLMEPILKRSRLQTLDLQVEFKFSFVLIPFQVIIDVWAVGLKREGGRASIHVSPRTLTPGNQERRKIVSHLSERNVLNVAICSFLHLLPFRDHVEICFRIGLFESRSIPRKCNRDKKASATQGELPEREKKKQNKKEKKKRKRKQARATSDAGIILIRSDGMISAFIKMGGLL